MTKQAITVNSLTTLIAAYKDRNPSLSYATVEQNLKDFLEIPIEVALENVINTADTSRVFFDSIQFVEEADSNGGFDAFVSTLAEQVGQDQTHPFKEGPLVAQNY